MFGAAGVVMALCCIAAPAALGAAVGAVVGNAVVGVGGAVAVALAAVLVVRRLRSASNVC
jgi:hypothetical protein